MTDYPDWVMKHKQKGTYINFVKGKYYLYAAHSERVSGTKKVTRVCDAYLGRITEADGLIPPKDKIAGTVTVLEYGLSSLILSVCGNIHKGFRRTFVKNGDLVMAASVLGFMYGKYNESLFRRSYMSVRFPGLDFGTPLSEPQQSGIDRGTRMIRDTMLNVFKEDLSDIMLHFSHSYRVLVNGKLYAAEEPDELEGLKQKHKIILED